MRATGPTAVLLMLACACGSDSGAGADGGDGKADALGDGGVARPEASEDWGRDILHTDLDLDLFARTGTATIELAGSAGTGASFEVGDLEILSVSDSFGPLHFTLSDARLDVGVPASEVASELTVSYRFGVHDDFDGWTGSAGVTFLWPTFCGNLFPCKSDPSEGVRFSLDVTGFADGKSAVFPASIPADAPSYMLAVAVGEYEELTLSATAAGTQVSVYYLPGQAADAATGSAHLSQVFDFFEQTYGPYAFGDRVASVSANWGPGAYGGMEHHPFWHIGTDALADEEVHAHEAAHGWYGNGVRIACWEDFVLSEGVTSYMAARALGEFGVDVWPSYECQLRTVCNPGAGVNTQALPDTCNQINLIEHPLWSSVPYMKGAYFLRAVADEIGESVLDEVLADFYQTHVGGAATMTGLVDRIVQEGSSAAIDALVDDWLVAVECPVVWSELCP